VWLTDRSISKSFLYHHCVVLYIVYVFYVRTAPVRSQHVAPRCTLRNTRPRLLPRLPLPLPTPLTCRCWPTCSRLRPRCCCCCCCCRPTAVGTPYERRQNGYLQTTISAAVESWQTGFNSLIVQHVRFFLGPTDVQPVAICLIWCRVVGSRDDRSRDFSAPPALFVGFLLQVGLKPPVGVQVKFCILVIVALQPYFSRNFESQRSAVN